MPGEKGGSPLLQKLYKIVSKVESFSGAYQRVIRWHRRVLSIAQILKPAPHKSSRSVEQELFQYLNETEETLTQSFDQSFVDNLKK